MKDFLWSERPQESQKVSCNVWYSNCYTTFISQKPEQETHKYQLMLCPLPCWPCNYKKQKPWALPTDPRKYSNFAVNICWRANTWFSSADWGNFFQATGWGCHGQDSWPFILAPENANVITDTYALLRQLSFAVWACWLWITSWDPKKVSIC